MCHVIFSYLLIYIKLFSFCTLLFFVYNVNVPSTVKIATVHEPSTAVVLVPGATAKLPGLQAVAILNKTIPDPPALPGSQAPVPPALPEPPPPPVFTVPSTPV
jgi:hypothetical protein